MNEKILLDKLLTDGIDMEDKDKKYNNVKMLLKIDDIETTITGPEAKHDYLKKWEAGQAIAIFYFKSKTGEAFNYLTKLFTKSGKLAIYSSFSLPDGTKKASSVIGEMIKRIKEYDEKQWESESKFTLDKLIEKKFEIEVFCGTDKENKNFYIPQFEIEIEKAQKRRNKYNSVSSSDDVTEAGSIDPNDLPF